jgi:hypothetical protein
LAHIALPVGPDNSRGKKVNIHKRFWLSTLVFFRLARRTNILKGRIATRRAPRRGFLFRAPLLSRVLIPEVWHASGFDVV